jgi:amino acid transporter
LKMWSGNHKPYYPYPTETIGKRPFKVTKWLNWIVSQIFICTQLESLSHTKKALKVYLTFWVGFHLSQGSSPLWGSSTGGWRIEMHKSPF